MTLITKNSMAAAFSHSSTESKRRVLNESGRLSTPPPKKQKREIGTSISRSSFIADSSARQHESHAAVVDGKVPVASVGRTKIFNDSIHNHIKVDDLSRRIIDTHEFQRLSRLKQLGTCDFVFRGATHTRFEHSIGVSHLAERVMKKLQENQPDLEITSIDILCVKIAGLCHDLGHGPFSHVFDGVFMKLMNEKDERLRDWRHEDGSVNMFRHLLVKNDIKLEDYGMTSQDQLFIEEIIGGVNERDRKGRSEDKFYMYDVVNNTRSGLDVDKLDYFQRDMKYANVVYNANFDRFIELGRVLPCVDVGSPSPLESFSQSSLKNMIAYPDKLVREAVDLFCVRFKMHHHVYTHKGVKQVEYMMTDALMLADPFIRIRGSVRDDHPTGEYRISECVHDMEAFSNLDDHIATIIRFDRRPELQPAQEILGRIARRKLYVCLGHTNFNRTDNIHDMSTGHINAEIVTLSRELVSGSLFDIPEEDASNNNHLLMDEDDETEIMSTPTRSNNHVAVTQPDEPTYLELEEHDIIVEKMLVHYGLKDKNPVARMRFYSKHPVSGREIGTKIPEEFYKTSLPIAFEEQSVRVFCRNPVKEVTARRAFEIWCKKQNTHSPFLQSQFSQQKNASSSQSRGQSQHDFHSP